LFWLYFSKYNISQNCDAHFVRFPVPNPMKFFKRPSLLSLFALPLLAFSSCEQRVVLTPGEDDLVVLNGCVISACNYLAVVKTQHKLDPNFWAKVLLVRFDKHLAGHAYCVWETEGTIYGYDRNSGGFPIPVYTRDARSIAIVLAQELGKIMHQPLSVATAEFIEPVKAELYKFSGSTGTDAVPPAVLGLATVNRRSLSLAASAQK
jgi:hypothetical protein